MFQSTRPVRGATSSRSSTRNSEIVSIHAPRAGRDVTDRRSEAPQDYVSIHAPRAGRDFQKAIHLWTLFCFNPRAPCGARLSPSITSLETCMFQSTRPVRGATAPL